MNKFLHKASNKDTVLNDACQMDTKFPFVLRRDNLVTHDIHWGR